MVNFWLSVVPVPVATVLGPQLSNHQDFILSFDATPNNPSPSYLLLEFFISCLSVLIVKTDDLKPKKF